jgi:hypothetical protein
VIGACLALTVAATILLSATPAMAAVNCFAEASLVRVNTSTGQAKARAYCTNNTIYQIHVYARLYRTDTSPATTLASNSRTCELSQFCPADGVSWVKASGGLRAGCHTYQARTGGYWEPLGMPVPLPFTAVYNSDIRTWCS